MYLTELRGRAEPIRVVAADAHLFAAAGTGCAGGPSPSRRHAKWRRRQWHARVV